MEMTLRQMLGQKLIFGFHGTTLSEEFKELVREYRIGNVILFARNVESAAQLRALCAQIQSFITEVTGYPAFIVIDQEGGLVSRLPEDAVNVPGAMALGAVGDADAVREASQITIRQLQGLGANFNMAPVLDVNTNPHNPVIGVRSFGDDPRKAAELAEATVRPYAGSGIYCCGKHFPGHGDTCVDSHLGLPRVDKTLEELEAAELLTFRRCIDSGIPAIMTSHILFPRIERENVPCTMSRTMITGLLKEKLGFGGLVFSDCMEMQAIRNHYGTAAGAVAAFQAGVDLVELSKTTELMRETAQAVNDAAAAGMLDPEELRGSVEKILRMKRAMLVQAQPQLCNRPEDRAAARGLHRRAITCVSGRVPPIGENTFFCGCGNYRASQVANPEDRVSSFPEYLAAAFGGKGMEISRDPGADEICAVLEAAEGSGCVVLGTINAHLQEGQLELARKLVQAGKKLVAVALRNPYDLALLPEGVCKIAAYDYSQPCFEALAEVLRGGEATGSLPVKLR